MNTETFFQQFELLADAPNGIQKLRELILQLAVQGKLVPQNPDDEPAAVLLERIKAEKERLVKEGKIKKSKKLPDIKPDEIPFDLPEDWEWIKTNLVAEVIDPQPSHRTPPKAENGVPYIGMGDIDKESIINFDKARKVAIEVLEEHKNRYTLKDGDFIFGKIGTLGKPVKLPKPYDYTLSANIVLIQPTKIAPDYLFLYMSSPVMENILTSLSRVTTHAAFGIKRIRQLPTPLPPLAEQKRIVEKVDRLMELCDKLETQQQQQKAKTLQLGTVATSRLTAAKTPEAFKQHWQNISNNFDLIYSTPENIKQLRQTILQLAVMGKLVPQNPDDESASVLLAKIKAEKGKLIKEGKIKKSKKLKAISPDEIPYELPKVWELVKLGECIELISGQHLNQESQNKEGIGLPYLTGPSDFTETHPIATRWTRVPKAIAVKNDILITVKGAGVGKSNILTLDEAAIGRQLMAIRPFFLEVNYLYILILASFEKFQALSIGSTVPGIGRENIFNFPLSLPPLGEQHRIVTKVNQLMTYCDELEAKLTQSLSDKEKLMDTAVYQLLTA